MEHTRKFNPKFAFLRNEGSGEEETDFRRDKQDLQDAREDLEGIGQGKA